MGEDIGVLKGAHVSLQRAGRRRRAAVLADDVAWANAMDRGTFTGREAVGECCPQLVLATSPLRDARAPGRA